jgi:LemA protein
MIEDKKIESGFPMWIIPFVIVVALVVCIATPIGMSYNSLVASDVKVEQSLGNIHTTLEKRADMIPNIVATVQGSANFEKNTLVEVIAMRGQATQIKEKVKAARTVEDIQEAQDELGAVVGRLLMLNEQYPQLQTVAAFRDLQSTLKETENEIRDQRQAYNEAAKQYKSNVRTFPSNIVAGVFGFREDKWPMFQVEAGKEKVPVVKFDT